MKTFLKALIVCELLAIPIMAALKVADPAPDVSGKASLAGKEFSFSLQTALKKGPLAHSSSPPESTSSRRSN